MTKYSFQHKDWKDTFLTFEAKDLPEAGAMLVTLTARPNKWNLFTLNEMIEEIVRQQKVMRDDMDPHRGG